MRLLHSTTLELQDFPDYEGVHFAILSHTWADEEVLFEDIRGFDATTIPPHIKRKSGYEKLQACCAQATTDGFEYVLIDTCCIDKSSSAELSEAINSMYRWYQDAAVCYVYLADVPNIVDPHTQKERFRQSRWFTRGWTLQELIAPEAVEFYGSQWRSQGQEASLGTKLSLQDEIFETTRIPIEVLQGSDLRSYGIAQKMLWASQRKTTRMEDRAYSLLGLFNVNMPLLYGEGNRAFIRLQEEIMKTSTDESLFAWSMGRCGYFGQGLLAMSPDYFANSGGIKRVSHVPRTTPFTVTNKGLRLEVILLKASDVYETSILERQYAHLNQIQVAVLNCCQYSQERLLGIHLGYFKYGEEEGTCRYTKTTTS